MEEIERAFVKHRSAFDELDSMIRDGDQCARTDGEITAPERCERYRDLLGDVGTERGHLANQPDGSLAVSLPLGDKGNFNHAYYIRAVKLENEPDSVVADVFDHLEREGTGGYYSVYSPLEDGWYVELEMAW